MNPMQLSRADTAETGDMQGELEACRRIVAYVLAGYVGRVSICLWDGQFVAGSPAAECIVVFRQPGPLRELLLHQDLLQLVEYYLGEQIQVEGDIEVLFGMGPYLESLRFTWRDKLWLFREAMRLPRERLYGIGIQHNNRLGAQDNSSATIAYHYDVGNEFYALWLDPERVYSCAYFRRQDQDLASAQRDKLDYICRKLRLSAGQTLLDIGCGWGALACWAARHYGVSVTGITLSKEQYDFASHRVHNEGLEERVTIELCDYRDLEGEDRYDRVVSVGMFEHVGVENFPVYFGMVRRVLKQDGLFLNHGITNATGWEAGPQTAFMNRYIFPDGELARICDVMSAMEQAGFEVVDVESLRRHYVLTLREWIRALEKHRDAIVGVSSTRIYRLWRLYMAGCAYNFANGGTNVYQLLAVTANSSSSLPLRRDDLYMQYEN